MVPSRRSFLAAINYTEFDIEIVCYDDVAGDWDGDARPSKQFPPWTILKPFRRIEKVLETANSAGWSVLTYWSNPTRSLLILSPGVTSISGYVSKDLDPSERRRRDLCSTNVTLSRMRTSLMAYWRKPAVGRCKSIVTG